MNKNGENERFQSIQVGPACLSPVGDEVLPMSDFCDGADSQFFFFKWILGVDGPFVARS